VRLTRLESDTSETSCRRSSVNQADFLLPITVSEAKSFFAEGPEPEPAASGSPSKGQEPNVGSQLA
jgi:hypothetical protein